MVSSCSLRDRSTTSSLSLLSVSVTVVTPRPPEDRGVDVPAGPTERVAERCRGWTPRRPGGPGRPLRSRSRHQQPGPATSARLREQPEAERSHGRAQPAADLQQSAGGSRPAGPPDDGEQQQRRPGPGRRPAQQHTDDHQQSTRTRPPGPVARACRPRPRRVPARHPHQHQQRAHVADGPTVQVGTRPDPGHHGEQAADRDDRGRGHGSQAGRHRVSTEKPVTVATDNVPGRPRRPSGGLAEPGPRRGHVRPGRAARPGRDAAAARRAGDARWHAGPGAPTSTASGRTQPTAHRRAPPVDVGEGRAAWRQPARSAAGARRLEPEHGGLAPQRDAR